MARGKTYRTANGQNVDFGAMMLANETAPALGNMKVNARGDEISPDGTITKSREQIMREYNEMNTMVPVDDDIPEGTNIAQADEDDWQDWEPAVQAQPQTTDVVDGHGDVHEVVQSQPDEETKPTPTGGLAAAVAAAKKVEQNVQPARGTEERENPGVRRI